MKLRNLFSVASAENYRIKVLCENKEKAVFWVEKRSCLST